MSTYKFAQESAETYTDNANKVKEALLSALEAKGLLKKPAAEIAETIAVVAYTPGVFGSLFRKLKGEDPKAMYFRVMEIPEDAPKKAKKAKKAKKGGS